MNRFIPVALATPEMAPNDYDILKSEPVLALRKDGTQSVVRRVHLDPEDPNTAPSRRTAGANQWDITAQVIGWMPLPEPKLYDALPKNMEQLAKLLEDMIPAGYYVQRTYQNERDAVIAYTDGSTQIFVECWNSSDDHWVVLTVSQPAVIGNAHNQDLK